MKEAENKLKCNKIISKLNVHQYFKTLLFLIFPGLKITAKTTHF